MQRKYWRVRWKYGRLGKPVRVLFPDILSGYVVLVSGYYFWIPCLVILYGYFVWIPCLDTLSGYLVILSRLLARVYILWLDCPGTSVWIPCPDTVSGYLVRIPYLGILSGYVAQICCPDMSPGYVTRISCPDILPGYVVWIPIKSSSSRFGKAAASQTYRRNLYNPCLTRNCLPFKVK